MIPTERASALLQEQAGDRVLKDIAVIKQQAIATTIFASSGCCGASVIGKSQLHDCGQPSCMCRT